MATIDGGGSPPSASTGGLGSPKRLPPDVTGGFKGQTGPTRASTGLGILRRVSDGLGAGTAHPHQVDHGSGIFNHPSTNRATAGFSPHNSGFQSNPEIPYGRRGGGPDRAS